MLNYDIKKSSFYALGVPDKIIKKLMDKGFSLSSSEDRSIERGFSIFHDYSSWIEMGVPVDLLSEELTGRIYENGTIELLTKKDGAKILSYDCSQISRIEAILSLFRLYRPSLRNFLFSLDLYFPGEKDIINAGYNLTMAEAKSLASRIKNKNQDQDIIYQILDSNDCIAFVSKVRNGKHEWKNGSFQTRTDFAFEKINISRCRCGDTPRISFAPVTGFVVQCSNVKCSALSTAYSFKHSVDGWNKMFKF